MHLDLHGLPTQKDGDARDQLQRIAMILVAGDGSELAHRCAEALRGPLQPRAGVFTRSTGSDPANASADQLISALGAFLALRDFRAARVMFWRMLSRFGFAQNIRDGLGASQRRKIPDFMFLRAMPLFVRAWPAAVAWPLAVVFDLYLPVLAASAVLYARASKDNVDHNVTVITFFVTNLLCPTPLSRFANWIFARFLPESLGSENESHRVLAALRWYHRAEAGGNPEVAEMWAGICRRLWS